MREQKTACEAIIARKDQLIRQLREVEKKCTIEISLVCKV